MIKYRKLDFLGFPGYRVGTDGSVWTKKNGAGEGFRATWRRKRPGSVGSRGRRRKLCMVSLWNNGKGITHYISRLVLLSFVGPPLPGQEACHFPDPDPSNNSLANLRWGTGKENNAHKKIHGTVNLGERNGSAKLNPALVRKVRRLRKRGMTQSRIAGIVGLAQSSVGDVLNGKTWSHVEC